MKGIFGIQPNFRVKTTASTVTAANPRAKPLNQNLNLRQQNRGSTQRMQPQRLGERDQSATHWITKLKFFR